jgi:antitoxin MazE
MVLTSEGKNMQVSVRKMGNSHGILIPKPVLLETGLRDVAELTLNQGVIEIRPVKPHPRAQWAADAQRIATAGDDALVWPDVGNEADADLTW